MDERETDPKSSRDEVEKAALQNSDSAELSESTHAEGKRNSQEGLSGDALAWLEGPAFGDPVEEMPTLQWSDGQKENKDTDRSQSSPEAVRPSGTSTASEELSAQEGDELEDAIQWLEQMAEDQGIAIDETPTLVSNRDQDMDMALAAVDGLNHEGDTLQVPELDSDPMAWLEQLAIDQDSPLEELPSVANRLLASEIVSQIDPDQEGFQSPEPLISQVVELDAALRYLEKQAEAEGIALDEVSFDEIETSRPVDEELEVIDQLAVATALAVTEKSDAEQSTEADDKSEWDDLTEQIPEDPDEALVWLGELAEEEDTTEPASDGSVLAKGAAVAAAAKMTRSGDEDAVENVIDPVPVIAEESLDTDVLEGMPDDPDEAMAWMEGLAAPDEDDQAGRAPSRTIEEHEKQEAGFTEDLGAQKDEDFSLARAALMAGAVDAATKHYRKLLDDGQVGPVLIEDLETAVAEQPDNLELVQLLGDAYMEDGQLQKALNAYRKGFDHL